MADSEPSPRSRIEASTSLTGFSRTNFLRPRSIIENYGRLDGHEIEEGEPRWRPGELLPARLEDGPNARPQVAVAEATRDEERSPFMKVSSSTVRELFASAPSLSAGSIRGQAPNTHRPSRNDGAPAEPPPPNAAHFRATGHVQFSDSLGATATVPGEVPSPGLNLTQQGLSSAFTFQAPVSPERPGPLHPIPSLTMPVMLSNRTPPSARGTTGHWAHLDRPEDVAGLQLELTLQHSNRIEKITAADLRPFGAKEQPFYYGQHQLHATIRGVRGAHELNRGCFYVPSDITDSAASGLREVISGSLSWANRQRPLAMQLFVLFPSLMRPPSWLRRNFTQRKTAAVEVDWHLSQRTKFILHLMRRLEKAERQTLTVWTSKRRYGATGNKTSASFTLYGAEGTAEFTDRSYVLVMRFFELREGPPPLSFVASREGALPRSLTHLIRHAGADDFERSRLMATGGGGGGGHEYLSATSFAYGPNLHRGLTRLEALQELQRLRGGRLDLESTLEDLVTNREGPTLRRIIESHLMDLLLRSQDNVDKVEKVARANNDPLLMMTLYEHTNVEMDLDVLVFLVHCWASQPLTGRAAAAAAAAEAAAANHAPFAAEEDAAAECYDAGEAGINLSAKIEEFLVKYVVKRRNPLSSTAAILRAIDDEMNQHEENRRVMRLASSRFHSLHLALLRKLNRYADVRNIRVVERILQPAELPNTVNEVSPLQVAFDSQDLKFMTETLIELFTKVQWRGGELLALTSHEDPRTLGATNPLLAYSVLRSLGFAGKGTLDPLVMAASRLWHLYAFTSTAFFNSPRGRWAMHTMCELCFLFLYQWQVMWPRLDAGHLQVLHLVFLCFILGNLLDMAQFVHYRYGSLARIRRYLVDPWSALSLLVNGGLLVLTCLKLAQDFRAPGLEPYRSADAIHMCMATLAVFVWVRALGMAVPVYPSLGPLLNTVARMMEEVIAFLFPMLIVMTGFSTMMAAIYSDEVDAYNGFASALLQLFSSMLGNFDFTLFDGLSVAQRLYGIIAQVIFLVISAILLMNLLIAIVTNRYRPQEVEAESQFKKAQVVTYYQTQVHRNLVCAPFCLVQVSLQAINLPPSGRRNKVNSGNNKSLMLGLLPLDGVVLPDDGSDRPTGLAELPHFIYLITLYPIIAAATWVLFLLYTPFGVWQFAIKQYNQIGKRYSKRIQAKRRKQKQELEKKQQAQQANKAATLGTDGILAPPTARAISTPPGSPLPPSSSSAAASSPASAGGAVGGGAGNVARSQSNSLVGSEISKQYKHLKKALQEEAHRSDVSFVHTTLFLLGTALLAAVGLVVYLLVIMLLVLVGWSSLYQWLAKILFSLYNIFLHPMTDGWKARRRRQRISPSGSPSPAGSGRGSRSGPGSETSTAAAFVPETGRSHIALAVASGVGVAAVAGAAVPTEHGCAGDALGGGDRRAVSLVAWFGAKSARAAAGGSGGGGGSSGGGGAAIAGGGGDGDGDGQALQLPAREDSETARRRKARMHWWHAVQKVVAMKNERYLSRRDVLKALAKSKFKPHMAGWNLVLDTRTSSQDILDEQMEDLEDDDDPWDDDEMAQGGEDDDTMEATILEKTEALTEMLKNGIAAQSRAMTALAKRVAQLAEELASLRDPGPSPAHHEAGPDSGAGLGVGEDVDGAPDGLVPRGRPSQSSPGSGPVASALASQSCIRGHRAQGLEPQPTGGSAAAAAAVDEVLLAAALPVLRNLVGAGAGPGAAAAAALRQDFDASLRGRQPSDEGGAGRRGADSDAEGPEVGAGKEEEGQRGAQPLPPPPPPHGDNSPPRPTRTRARTAVQQHQETTTTAAARKASLSGAADGAATQPVKLAKQPREGASAANDGGEAPPRLFSPPPPPPQAVAHPPPPARAVSAQPSAASRGSASGTPPPSAHEPSLRVSSAGAGGQHPPGTLLPPAGAAASAASPSSAQSSFARPVLEPIKSVRHGVDSVATSLRLDGNPVGSPAGAPPLRWSGPGAVRQGDEALVGPMPPITEERSSAATSAAAASQQQAKGQAQSRPPRPPPADGGKPGAP